MATTVRELLKGSLRALGRVGRGRDMTAEQGADALEIVNQMLASWIGENLTIPARTKRTFSYATSKNEYTIGDGGDLDVGTGVKRPDYVLDAFHRDPEGNDYALELMSFRRYGDIGFKAVENYPTRLYYEPEYPLGKIHYDFQPLTTLTLHLTTMEEIAQFTSLNQTIALPDSHLRAIKFNLCVDLAPDYGMKVSAEIMTAAVESKKNIKRLARANREEVLIVDRGIRRGGRYSITSDNYGRQ